MPAKILYETQGRKLLVRYLETTTQAAFAKRIGVCQQTVSDMRHGKTRPESVLRDVIESVTGIERDAWLMADERRRIKAATRAA